MASLFHERDNGGMLPLPPNRDGVELFANRRKPTNNADLVLTTNLGFDHSRSRKESVTRLAEGLQVIRYREAEVLSEQVTSDARAVRIEAEAKLKAVIAEYQTALGG